MPQFDIKKIQNSISKFNWDGWLFFDFRGSNDLALNILDIPKERHLTRRFFYFIPASGEPVKIVNAIEARNLDHLPGKKLTYSNHASLDSHLKSILTGVKTLAMEYSPLNAIPYVSKVDAGTIEKIKSFGVDIKSSADLISLFDAIWTDDQYLDNKPVADSLYEIVMNAFAFIKEKTLNGGKVTEYDVQKYIMIAFEDKNYFTDHPPIVGVNENSANPHYAPSKTVYKDIKPGDFVLIDLWAKVDKPEGVWADITWVGYMGETVPEKYTKIFNIVAEARDAAFNLVKKHLRENVEIRGYEVDDASRNVIVKAGYGDYFIHRTGHSITTTLHGSGAHMDNYETRDERLLLPATSFSIEPGIYLTGDFGIRSEIDVYITPDGEVISTGKDPQKEIIPILK
jgi:Xaa-Pro dipeptidase